MNRPITLALVSELFRYNYWARDQQLRACAALTEEQFVRPAGSFTSISDTLTHLLAVEWIWLERWRGRSPKSLLSPTEFPALAAMVERWRLVESEMREYLGSLSEEALDQPVTYVNLRGEAWSYELWRMILHLINHQSYHRGQVATLLRQTGVQPPAVDLLVAHDAGITS